MRLIRHKVTKPTALLLKELADTTKTERDYLTDLYALLVNGGSGIPSEDRLVRMIPKIAKKTATSETSTSIFARKRRQQLRQVSSDPLFHAFGQQSSKITGLRMYLAACVEISMKSRQAKCLTCTLLEKCAFGKEYGSVFKDPAEVLDADFKNKIHADCPDYPAVERTNQIGTSIEIIRHMFSQTGKEDKAMINQMPAEGPVFSGAGNAEDALEESMDQLDEGSFDEDDEDSQLDAEEGSPFYAGLSGANKNRSLKGLFSAASVENYAALVTCLTKQRFLLWELGRKFSVALSAKGKGKDVTAQTINKNTRDTKMERPADIAKIVPSQHGLPKEVFESKLDRKELLKVEHRKPENKKQLVYLLIDSSGSMRGFLTADGQKTKRAIFTRNALSSVFCTAMLRKIEADGGYAFVRFFGGSTTQCHIGRDKKSFELLRRLVTTNRYNGGGTDICHSVETASSDITRAALPDVSKSEILLITDCQDQFDDKKIVAALGTNELNVLDVSGGKFTGQGVSGLLQKVSAHYYKVDESVDVSKMIQTLK